ncbi:MAG: hypothetical protein D6785_16255, partial [Planctomycetota bacterium]
FQWSPRQKKKILSINLEEDILDFLVEKKRILVLMKNQVMVYSLKGKFLNKITDIPYSKAIVAWSGKIFLLGSKGRNIYELDFKKKEILPFYKENISPKLLSFSFVNEKEGIFFYSNKIHLFDFKIKKDSLAFEPPAPWITYAIGAGKMALSTFLGQIYIYKIKAMPKKKKIEKKAPMKKLKPLPASKKTSKKDEISGLWKGALDGVMGKSFEVFLRLKLKGEEVSGTIEPVDSSRGKAKNISQGSFKNGKLELEINMGSDNPSVKMSILLRIEASLVSSGQLQGHWKFKISPPPISGHRVGPKMEGAFYAKKVGN